MEKKHLVSGIGVIGMGLVFFALSFLDSRLQAPFCGFGGACLGAGIAQTIKYVYWSKPERLERYQEKMENMKIIMEDERKEVLRYKSGWYMYIFTLIVLGLTVSVIQILENYGVLEGARWVVIFLGILFFAELFLGWLIYRQMDKKY